MAKYQILTLNQISSQGLHRFPTARYSVGKSAEHPDAILVRKGKEDMERGGWQHAINYIHCGYMVNGYRRSAG